MNIYRDISEIEYNRDTIVSLGTFDGVHKGHQKIINRLNEIARQDNLRPLIITMDPHPRIVLQNPDKPKIQLLTSIKERLDLFQKFGVENVFIIHFTYEFSQTSPEEFIKNYLVDKIGLKKFLMGREHFFGRNRQG
ncbi:MAG TPA: adenylyltransferase/cytidyltransferase family protein, partial [Candidatus Kapabacteria bacterium]|nr:adenylyltransferase/cytidyltransferase family protein [Candidatus Kapabacteria bacterium]